MYHQSIHPLLLLFLLLDLSLRPFAINLGIRKDALSIDQRPVDIQSYTGHITFTEDTKNSAGQYPPQYMSDEKMLKLLVLAYNEMVVIFDRSLLDTSRRPGAMIALAFGKEMFFASSMKGAYQAWYQSSSPNRQVSEVLSLCQLSSESSHRLGLACGEPNVLDLCHSALGSGFILDQPARITAWITWGRLGQETNYRPCLPNSSGYGCQAIVKAFGLHAFWDKTPDPADGSEWSNHYTISFNPRVACVVP